MERAEPIRARLLLFSFLVFSFISAAFSIELFPFSPYPMYSTLCADTAFCDSRSFSLVGVRNDGTFKPLQDRKYFGHLSRDDVWQAILERDGGRGAIDATLKQLFEAHREQKPFKNLVGLRLYRIDLPSGEQNAPLLDSNLSGEYVEPRR
jgi:hypothetical protein